MVLHRIKMRRLTAGQVQRRPEGHMY